jgi:hypothetical protein
MRFTVTPLKPGRSLPNWRRSAISQCTAVQAGAGPVYSLGRKIEQTSQGNHRL